MRHPRWPQKKIGDLFGIDAGKTMSSRRSPTQQTPRPFLRTSNVLWDEINVDQVDSMPFEDGEFEAKLVRPGDLLVCEGGEIGRAAVWSGELERVSFQNHLHRLRPLGSEIEPRFYVFFLQCAFTQLGIFAGAGNNTTIPNLSRNRLAALNVPVPSGTEQREVVQALGSVRRSAKLHASVVDTSRALQRMGMHELFSRGLRGDGQKHTEIGTIPQGWEVVRLADVCQLSTGTTPSTKRPDYYVGDVPFIKTADIVNCRIRSSAAHISKAAVTDYGLKVYPPGTVLMAMYGQGKTRGQVALLEIAATTTQNAAALQPTERIDPTFLWYYLLSRYEHLRAMGSLGHISHLNLGYLRALPIVLPSLEEQREIVSVLDAIERKITLHNEKSTVVDALFRSLLYKVMTGEVNVADLNLGALAEAA